LAWTGCQVVHEGASDSGHEGVESRVIRVEFDRLRTGCRGFDLSGAFSFGERRGHCGLIHGLVLRFVVL
jgi:hypothetical protein